MRLTNNGIPLFVCLSISCFFFFRNRTGVLPPIHPTHPFLEHWVSGIFFLLEEGKKQTQEHTHKKKQGPI